jgi:serine/threonine protein kinase
MILQPGSRPVPNHPGYELVRKLGRGGFGEVWRSRAPGGVDVALKFVPLESASRAATELRAIEVMRTVRHPNLVTLLGAWYDDGSLILAMELCDGTLAERLVQALSQKLPGIPRDEVLGYMRDAASGLDMLTAAHIQHRDVKPANLLLLGSGVKVGDFGLAKVREQSAGNTVAGTLAYIAPECYEGKLAEQSDQYSLAITYYHLRTGTLPFKGHEAEVMRAKLLAEPDLSLLSPIEQMALARALSREPSKRWPSCMALVRELSAVMQRYGEEQHKRRRSRVVGGQAEAEALLRAFQKATCKEQEHRPENGSPQAEQIAPAESPLKSPARSNKCSIYTFVPSAEAEESSKPPIRIKPCDTSPKPPPPKQREEEARYQEPERNRQEEELRKHGTSSEPLMGNTNVAKSTRERPKWIEQLVDHVDAAGIFALPFALIFALIALNDGLQPLGYWVLSLLWFLSVRSLWKLFSESRT